MRPSTKFAATVPHTQRIPEITSMAFREAYNGRPGPSFLEIPRDVLDAKVDLDKVRFPEKYRSPYKVHGGRPSSWRPPGFSRPSGQPCWPRVRCSFAAAPRR